METSSMKSTTDDNNNEYKKSNEKSKRPNNNRMMLVLFISLVIDLLAFTVILPLLPSLLDFYNEKNELDWWLASMKKFVRVSENAKWNSVLFGGLIGSIFSALQFVSSPMIGALSDVHGRKPLMLLTSVGICLSYLTWAVSYTFPVFVLSRILGGACKGNVSLSTVIMGDITNMQNRSKAMALIGIAFSVGFLIGPGVGAWFSTRSKDTEYFFFYPAVYSLLLALLNVIFIMVFFEETLPADKRVPSIDYSNIKSLIHPLHLFNFKATSPIDKAEMKVLNLCYFCYLFIYSGLEFTLTFLTHMVFNYSSMQQGKMFFIAGLLMILFHGTVVRRVKKGDEIRTAQRGIIVLAVSFIIIAFSSSSQLVFYSGILLFAYASSTVVPCLTSKMSMLGAVNERGKVMGIFRSSGALARALGPLAASIVYWSISSSVCYVIGACLLVLPYVLLGRLKSA